MADDRLLALVGSHNLRDFGGYPTADGRHVRRGVLFRSGVMTHIAADELPRLRALGIATICDLRTATERERKPTRWADATSEMLIDDATPSTTTLEALLADPAATRGEMRGAMIALYRELPFRHAAMLRRLFAKLAAGRIPMLVNCSAGKDRTGVAVALLLRALGVAPPLVERDYLASNDMLDVPQLLADSGFGQLHGRREVIEAMMRVEPDYLTAAFDTIDTRCGSFSAYLQSVLNVTDFIVEGMRVSLLDL